MSACDRFIRMLPGVFGRIETTGFPYKFEN